MHNAEAVTTTLIHKLNVLNNFKNTYPYCGALLYKEKRRHNNYWQCCNNCKIDILVPDLLLSEAINALKLEDVKEKKQHIQFINNLFYETKEVNGRIQHIQYFNDFRNKVVNYNNILSFTNEHPDNIN